jgi:hypothetical protein
MAGWQEELAALLRELGVIQEEPQTNLGSDSRPMRSDAKWRLRPGRAANPLRGAFFSDNVGKDASKPWLTDLDAMRREVDSIVRQVVQLMQRGDLDYTLKEDVMEILRVLRKRAALSQQAESADSLDLETITAVLRFCRLVLCLSETAIEGF